MHQDEVKALFDQQADNYDNRWERTAAIGGCLHLLVDSFFAELPSDARILCVGAGTGAEMAHLANKNPNWRFTAVEPSRKMLEVCRQRSAREGFDSRCVFHEGFLATLPQAEDFNAATSFLVSQFILDAEARAQFFREIANRLKPGGLLASSDLASDVTSAEYDVLLRGWMQMMSSADISPENLERMRKAYAVDVGVLHPGNVAAIIKSGGFESTVQFFQAGLIHAWISRRGRIGIT